MRLSPFIGVYLLLHGNLVLANTEQEQQAWLLEQLRLGQSLYRDDIVQSALQRLDLVAPYHPEVVMASIEVSLEQGDQARAQQLLQTWQQQAEHGEGQQQAQALISLYDEPSQLKLRQARQLAREGQAAEALHIYRGLWQDQPPGLAFGLEHWRTSAALPAEKAQAIGRLEQMDSRYPGHPEVRLTLAELLLEEGRSTAALALLDSLASNPHGASRAAEMQFNYLASLPVTDQTAVLWQDFLSRVNDTSYQARGQQQWQRQQQLLKDPAWRAGEQGKQKLAAKQYAQAETLLRRALKQYPQAADLHGALGESLLQLNRYREAVAALTQAEQLETDGSLISKWHELRVYGQSLVLLQQGDQALEQQQYAVAARAYRQVMQLRPRDIDGQLGLARLALAEGDEGVAEHWLKQARLRDPQNDKVIYALVNFYRPRSLTQAEAVLANLSVSARRPFMALAASLRVTRLEQEIAAALQKSDQTQAIPLLEEAITLAPDQPWLSYQLANLLQETGQPAKAETVFEHMLQRLGQDPQARYAHGLYLAAQERDAQSLATLAHIERRLWSPDMEALATRVSERQDRDYALALREQGNTAAARSFLSEQASAANRLLLADWSLADGAYESAIAQYKALINDAEVTTDAQLGLAETYLALNDSHAAKAQLPRQLPLAASLNQSRRYINLLVELGEKEQAAPLMMALLAKTPEDPLLLRDAARLTADPQQALVLYGQSLQHAAQVTETPAPTLTAAELTQATRSALNDDWLLSSLKSDTARLYQQQNPSVQLQHDSGWRTDNNSSGVGDLRLQTTLLKAELPHKRSRIWLQAEQVELSTDPPGAKDKFGACNATENGCDFSSLDTAGTGLAIGQVGERWSWDLGHSPWGFAVDNWLGGITYSNQWQDIGYNLTASRRPVTNSLVSYAGAVDPVTGLTWGAVTATGLTLGMSQDQGAQEGIWANVAAQHLAGKNVADNLKLSAMTGYYYRLLNDLDQQLRIGSSAMYWHHSLDLSEDTLGQGGYYSPQHYVSFGLPVSYARRGQEWSLALDASLGWSYAQSEGHALYPDHGSAIANSGVALANGAARSSESASSSGVGISLAGQGEYRLTDHWSLGGGVRWQLSADYAPGHVFGYVRYQFKPWRGKLDLPIASLTPYGQWR